MELLEKQWFSKVTFVLLSHCPLKESVWIRKGYVIKRKKNWQPELKFMSLKTGHFLLESSAFEWLKHQASVLRETIQKCAVHPQMWPRIYSSGEKRPGLRQCRWGPSTPSQMGSSLFGVPKKLHCIILVNRPWKKCLKILKTKQNPTVKRHPFT